MLYNALFLHVTTCNHGLRFGLNLSTSSRVIVLTETHARMHARTHKRTIRKHNASGTPIGAGGIKTNQRKCAEFKRLKKLNCVQVKHYKVVHMSSAEKLKVVVKVHHTIKAITQQSLSFEIKAKAYHQCY